MNRFLLITLLIFISGCASDFGFQGPSQKIVSISEFKFKSGISGNVPPGLCQIKQLKSEREGYGVVFFSNCNPHTNNKSLVTLTYLNLGQTQSAGFFSEEKLNNSLASFQKYDHLNPILNLAPKAKITNTTKELLAMPSHDYQKKYQDSTYIYFLWIDKSK